MTEAKEIGNDDTDSKGKWHARVILEFHLRPPESYNPIALFCLVCLISPMIRHYILNTHIKASLTLNRERSIVQKASFVTVLLFDVNYCFSLFTAWTRNRQMHCLLQCLSCTLWSRTEGHLDGSALIVTDLGPFWRHYISEPYEPRSQSNKKSLFQKLLSLSQDGCLLDSCLMDSWMTIRL